MSKKKYRVRKNSPLDNFLKFMGGGLIGLAFVAVFYFGSM